MLKDNDLLVSLFAVAIGLGSVACSGSSNPAASGGSGGPAAGSGGGNPGAGGAAAGVGGSAGRGGTGGASAGAGGDAGTAGGSAGASGSAGTGGARGGAGGNAGTAGAAGSAGRGGTSGGAGGSAGRGGTSGGAGGSAGRGGTGGGASGSTGTGGAGAGGGGGTSTATPTSGPLHVDATNPRYFADRNGKIVYLAGSHTWGNFRDRGLTDPPAPFDFGQYLDFLNSHNHNFIRLWAWEQPHSWNNNLDQMKRYFIPFPWPRTGPGMANDGKLKFDLSQFDQSFFDRMRARVVAAAARGVYVSVMLFDGWDVANAYNTDDGGFPYASVNNINGLDASGTGSQTLSGTAVTAIQDALVRKIVDTVNDLDNVLYEIANEAHDGSVSWQYHMINLLHQYEATKTYQHPVGMTTPGGGDDPSIMASPAEWVSPVNPYLLSDGSKVVINDTDHSYYWTTLESDGAATQRAWAFKTLTLGASPLFMDPYLEVWQARNAPNGNTPDPMWNPLRDYLGYTRRYADRLDLHHAVPSASLSSTGYCLANPGSQYLVYQPSSGAFTVVMTAGTYNYEWFNPATGTVAGTGSMTLAAGSVSFTPPFSGDAVLLLTH